jgi:predicted Co/Zn/Cd cation transporter (cation efflux family)
MSRPSSTAPPGCPANSRCRSSKAARTDDSGQLPDNIALLLQGTTFEHWNRYVDSLLLMVLTVCFMPVPIGIVRRAMKEVFLIAPSGIDREVHAAMAPVMQREGLLEYFSHVAKAGRGHYIEIHIVTTPEFAYGQGIAELDEIREQISAGLSIPPSRRWFTVAFTADPRWA